MNISAKVEYACQAVLELALQTPSATPIPLKKIAEPYDIPTQFLVQILLQLKAAGIVQSIRGVAGGYLLAMAPDQIRLGDIVRAVEGVSTAREGGTATKRTAARVLQEAWQTVDAKQWELLDGITFAQLAQRVAAPREPMYYI